MSIKLNNKVVILFVIAFQLLSVPAYSEEPLSALIEICNKQGKQTERVIAPQGLSGIAAENFLREIGRELPGQSSSSKVKTNAFWDNKIFGAGYFHRRPRTEYQVQKVAPDGRVLSYRVDYEFDWKDIFKGVARGAVPRNPEAGVPVYFAHRWLPDEKFRTVILIPDQLRGVDQFLRSSQAIIGDKDVAYLVLRRKYNQEEGKLLAFMNRVALNYRNHLKAELEELQGEIKRSGAKASFYAGKMGILKKRISELRAFHLVDVPPNASPGLLYQGPGFAKIPKDAKLATANMLHIGFKNHFVVFQDRSGKYHFGQIERIDNDRFVISTIDHYEQSPLSETPNIERGAKTFPKKDISPKHLRYFTVQELKSVLNRFWVIERDFD